MFVVSFCATLLLNFALAQTSIQSGLYQYSFYQNGTDALDMLNGVWADSHGNIYVTGWSLGQFMNANTTKTLVTYKMDSSGNILNVITPFTPQSENSFGIIGKEFHNGTSMVVVCGSTQGSMFGPLGGGVDGILYALNGDTFDYVWTMQMNDTMDSILFHMAWDETDTRYFFAVGTSENDYPEYGAYGSGYNDIMVLKIDSTDGSVVWLVLFGSAGDEQAATIAVDLTGAIFVAGSIGDSIPAWNISAMDIQDAVVMRLSHSGAVEWVTVVQTDQLELLEGLAVSDSSIFASGYTYGNLSEDGTPRELTSSDYYFYAILSSINSTNGKIQWLRWEETTEGNIGYSDVQYADGVIYIGGSINGLEFQNRTRVAYDFDGLYSWYTEDGQMTYLDFFGADGDETILGLFLGAHKVLYAVAYTSGNMGGLNLGGLDFLTVKAVPPASEESSGEIKDNLTIVFAVVFTVVPVASAALIGGLVLFRRKQINDMRRRNHEESEEELKIVDNTPKEAKNSEYVNVQNTIESKPTSASPNTESPKKAPPAAEGKDQDWNDYWELDYSEIRIGKELGRGAFGVVFKAEWRNSECVVKQAQLGTAENKTAMIAFLKEAEAIKNLRNHRNVCSILGVCTNPAYPICIVMQYCNGGNLENAIRSGKITLDSKNLIRIAKDVCSGMSHIHKENILHLDLACRNLLVDFDGPESFVIKISDFGLAKVTENGKIYATQDTMFSFRWTPPEGFKQMKFTRATDVWAFGVVLWEIIECQVPYGSMTNTQVMDYIVNQKKTLPPPSRIPYPPVFYEIMQMCWQYDMTQRPTFDELFQLFRHLENTGITQDGIEGQEIEHAEHQETKQQSVYGRKSTMEIPIPSAAYINNSLDSFV